jgi:beta-lactam-binding protein with PASTA domain
MPGAYGGTVAAPIWHDFMLVAMEDLRVEALPSPPAPETARVPDVVGMTKAEAVEVLTKAHFTPIPASVPSADPINQVVGQEPAGGSEVTAGSAVTIRLSNGKVPTTTVPDVVGLPQRLAENRLRQAGFVVEWVQEATPIRREHGRVISQAPGPGAELEEGYPVAIIVGVYTPPVQEAPPSPVPPEEDG